MWSDCGHLNRRSVVTDHLHGFFNSDSLVLISVNTVGCPGISLSFAIIFQCAAVFYGGRDILLEAFTGRVVHKKVPASKRIKNLEPDNPPLFSLYSSAYLNWPQHTLDARLSPPQCLLLCTILFLLCYDEGFQVVTTVIYEFCLLAYKALQSVESQPMFRRNISSPSSGLNQNFLPASR
jgi:hypothetical protein